jgi:hypothetical protein
VCHPQLRGRADLLRSIRAVYAPPPLYEGGLTGGIIVVIFVIYPSGGRTCGVSPPSTGGWSSGAIRH